MFFDRVLKVENIGPGKTAIITPGLNATYDKFVLLLGGGVPFVAADLTAIRIKANDIEMFRDTGPNLNSRQAYKNISTAVTEVTIDFTEPHAKGSGAGPNVTSASAQQYAASLPGNLLKKLVIEVDIAAGASATGTLACSAEFRGPTVNPYILKRRVFNSAFPGAQDNDLFLPAGGNGGIIKRVWLHDGGLVSKAILRVGPMIALNFNTMLELQRVQARNGLVPQANIDVLDFIADGNLQGALNTAAGSSVSLRLTSTGAGPLQGFIAYIDPIGTVR